MFISHHIGSNTWGQLSESTLRRYLLAPISVGVATLVRWLLDPVFGMDHPLLLYYGAMAVTAWRGGWWPAVVSLVLGYLVADWFFIPPKYDVGLLSLKPTPLIGFGTFLFTGVMIAAFSEAAKRAQHRAESNAMLAQRRGDVLEKEVVDRTLAEEALRENQERLRLALEAARMVAWEWDIRTDETVFSPNAAEVIGLSPPFKIKDSRHGLGWLLPEDFLRHQQACSAAESKRSGYVSQFRFLRPDNGVQIWLEDHAKAVCDSAGNVVGVSGIVMDITQRKQAESQIEKWSAELEGRVRERTAQLQASNKELEAFSYSVSHDLRAPLRSIKVFSQMVREDYNDKLDDQGRQYLGIIDEAGSHMGCLIDDLLHLSRVTRSEMCRQPVDLTAMAGQIINGLQQLEPNRSVHVVIAPALRANGDERLLHIALENLLNNAWKFTSKQPAPKIEVGSEIMDGQTVFFVRDNGAGFDMAFADKLFGVFQRLHSPDEFQGTGIGLATVQRIIQKHGGEIWARSAERKGATFYFTLRDENGNAARENAALKIDRSN
ncbi:MAG: Multi-sensor signal transduction histidine kinase [Pedosphaera sp.]|nr:Multi-sensor signal transduction histidine kinase [Pedosphaera sp.]